MKKSALFFGVFLSVLLFAFHANAASRGITVVSKKGKSLGVYKDYHALVVGVGKYLFWPQLPNAEGDALEVAEMLKKLGFAVTTVLNPTSSELTRAIGDMVYRMGAESERGILFFYAGHGETESLADGTSMGYIIPADCPLLKKDPLGFSTHAVSMRDIESASLRIRSKHVLMLFDSCFSGALFALVRAVPDDISEKSALPVRQYITAGREDEPVPDHSMFKRCLMIGLEGDADLTGDGYVTGSELGMYLSDRVVNYTRSRQHPQYGKINNPNLDRGDFIFIPQKTLDRKAKQEQIQMEKAALLNDVEQLRKERAETQKLLEETKRLLLERAEAEKNIAASEAEKQALQAKLTALEEDKKTVDSLAQTRLDTSREGLEKETAKKKALEEELQKLRREKEESEARFAETQKRIQEEAARKKALEEELQRLKAERDSQKQEQKKSAVKVASAKIPSETQRTDFNSLPALKKITDPSASKPEEPAKKPAKKTDTASVAPAKPVPEKAAVLPEMDTVPAVKAGTATLIISSNKKEAEVYLGKKEISFWSDPDEAWIFRGKAPLRIDGITPGRHELRVHLHNHDDELKTIQFKPGETVELYVPLFRQVVDGGGVGGGGGG